MGFFPGGFTLGMQGNKRAILALFLLGLAFGVGVGLALAKFIGTIAGGFVFFVLVVVACLALAKTSETTPGATR